MNIFDKNTPSRTKTLIDKFIAESDSAFVQIKEAINSGNVRSYLKDQILDKNFKRLTEPE